MGSPARADSAFQSGGKFGQLLSVRCPVLRRVLTNAQTPWAGCSVFWPGPCPPAHLPASGGLGAHSLPAPPTQCQPPFSAPTTPNSWGDPAERWPKEPKILSFSFSCAKLPGPTSVCRD